MRVLKPAWVTHDGKPIYSVDIHPDNSRFATGGQGDDYGKIVIWNMGPVRDEALEKDKNVPKILCQMDSHTACVNCVKWSHDGKFLASGADDNLVMIWQTSRGAGPSKMFGSSGSVVIVEQWRPVFTLRGHTGDVLDISWSPQDVWLATCSVDNSIIVWNALKFPEQIATLKGHSGMVKGVTWDPVGKYVASQSDDRSVRVWRTRDWNQESVITKPFKECGGTTHSLRLNWSPDGNHIVSAHAMNNSGPTAQIIERQGFQASLDFVGHRKAITVVRFNPNILSKKTSPYTCCAIGSKDRSLSIWLTSLKRPLVVMHDLFENSIVDLSWAQNGLELMSCGIDGTVAFMDFNVNEIGHPLSNEEVTRLLEKTYGKGISLEMAANRGSRIIESAAMLNLQEKNKLEASMLTPTKNSDSSLLASNGGGDNTPFKPRDKQIETRTADGRRRITPIFLAPQPEVGEVPVPFTSNSNIEFHSSSEKSKIVVEKQNRVTAPGMLSPSSGSKSMPSPPSMMSTSIKEAQISSVSNHALTPSVSTKEVTTNKQANETTPEKQIIKVPATTPPEKDHIVNKVDKTPPTEKSEKRPVSFDSVEKTKGSKETKEKDSPVTSKDKTSSGLSLKRKMGDDNKKYYAKRGRPSKLDQAAREAARAANAMSPMGQAAHKTTPATTVGQATVQLPQKIITSEPSFELPALTIDHSTSIDILGLMGVSDSLTLEVENNLDYVVTKAHRIRCLKGGQVVWEHVLGSKISAVCGSKYTAAVACVDETVSIFSIHGRRLLPRLVTGSLPSIFYCSNYYVMLITRHGKLFVWNSQTLKAEIKQETLRDFMTAKDGIDKAIVTPAGIPLVTLKNKKTYSFNPDIDGWFLVDFTEDKLQSCSNHHRCVPSKLRPIGPLSSLQKQSRPSDQAFRAFQSNTGAQQTLTLSHLENQISSSRVLKSADEFKFWLETYIRYLSQEGLEERLKETCNDLLGPVYKSKSSTSWSKFVLGVDKHSILRSVLPTIGSDLRFQRLYTEYKDQLDMMQDSSV